METLSHGILIGLLETFSKGKSDALARLQITDDDFEILTGEHVWSSDERQQMRRCLETLANAALELRGLPTFETPAEYTAALIGHYVNEVNWQIACHTMQIGTAAADLKGIEPVTPQQLFKLLCQSKDVRTKQFDQALRKKMAKRIAKTKAVEEDQSEKVTA
ncbi:putative minor capsid protein [Eel River basin pequenovirus]|nr:putative minor capsid protein [Eel River basin pequenovirus]